jgi:hypothetical protein
VVSIEDEEQNSKKAKLEEKKPEINASDQDVKQGPSASASTATVIKNPFDWLSSGEISSFRTFLTVLSPVNFSTLLSTSAALVFLGQHKSHSDV